jgi:Cu/Ag efflux protein CusF
MRTSLAASALVAFCAGSTPAGLTAASGAVGLPRQENASVRESEATGRVRTIDKATRLITVVTPKNVVQQVYVPNDVKAFETLTVGDDVTVRFTDSTIVRANRQAQRTRLSDTTAQAREEAQKQGADTHIVQQLKLVVRVDEINRQTGEVMYRTADDMFGLQKVRDLKLLDGINPGDTVEIIYTRARAVSVAPAAKR